MQSAIFENARILDGSSEEGEHDRFVRVADGVIQEISDRPIRDSSAHRIDLRGKTLMPGLIDCHVHIVSPLPDPADFARLPDSYVALQAARIMKQMLQRGFTTVRDLGGADLGFQRAVDQKIIEGPRLVICGKAFVQTGGHTDVRKPYDGSDVDSLNRRLGSVSHVVDGVDAVRFAVREQLRLGAQFIKVMAAGGAASGAFPIRRLGFSRDELLTFVEEAEKAQTYVCGHLYSDEAVRRAVETGFQSVEHATLVEPATAKLMKEKDVIVTPTIIAYEAQKREEQALRLDPGFSSRLDYVIKKSPESLEIMHKAGVKMAYGTDLLGFLHKYQGGEFVIRGRTLPAIEVIRSATCNAADLLRMSGKIGTVKVGAYADLIVVEKDPLKDLSALDEEGRYIPLVMKDGDFIKNVLN
jgi:imidazolonepropionase-like amidohydrolase